MRHFQQKENIRQEKKNPKIDAKSCECTIDSCRTAHVKQLCLPKEYNFNEER